MDPDDPVDRIALPGHFHSEETGAAFAECVECGLPLSGCAGGYVVQKCSNGRETVFEFALCMRCGEALHASYSTGSREKIGAFFEENVDLGSRFEGAWELPPAELAEHLLSRCLTCGKEPEPGEPFTHAAVCEGAEMLVGHSPICLCGTCEESLNALVSKETRGEWDRFIERNFDLPPSGAVAPDLGKPVLVL